MRGLVGLSMVGRRSKRFSKDRVLPDVEMADHTTKLAFQPSIPDAVAWSDNNQIAVATFAAINIVVCAVSANY